MERQNEAQETSDLAGSEHARHTPDSNSSTTPTLTCLPSELLRLIVSYLMPPNDEVFYLGGKKDLQNANLTHPCLRQWVPEYMFQYMAFVIVTPGISSQLERLLVNPFGREISKYIRNVQVKVPPAIRWDLNYEEDAETLLENTLIKLCDHFHVDSIEDLTVDQQAFGEEYHTCMVEPFTNNERWFDLVSHAYASCIRVFPKLPKLEHVECGTCYPESHPTPTITNTFMTQWDEEASECDPGYVFAADPNLAWISGVILHSVPAHVKSLDLFAVNLDTLNRFATVNRLLSVMCTQHKLSHNPAASSLAVTKLFLAIGGQAGTHGTDIWSGNTGSIGMVRYWAGAINCFPNLKHFTLLGARREKSWAGGGAMTEDSDHGWLIWLFGRLVFGRLETFTLDDFYIAPETLAGIFEVMPTSLKRTSLSWLTLTSFHTEEDGHEQFKTWIEQVSWLAKRFPAMTVTMNPENIFEEVEDTCSKLSECEEARAVMAKLGVEFSTD